MRGRIPMLAGVRSLLLLFFVVVFSVAACLPVQAQVNGVPASVTSIGFGGNPINGIRASVTSLGPPNNFANNSFFMGNCCANIFLPPNLNSPFPGHPHHHKNTNINKDRADSFVGVVEPAYIPYPVPYADADDDSPDVAYLPAAGQRNLDPRAQRPSDRASAPVPKNFDSDKAAPIEPEEPVAAQPSTVLVFKDGHKSDVLNYAIVGDTLFDFSAGHSHKILLADLDLSATRKANDDRGVDFQIPASARQ